MYGPVGFLKRRNFVKSQLRQTSIKNSTARRSLSSTLNPFGVPITTHLFTKNMLLNNKYCVFPPPLGTQRSCPQRRLNTNSGRGCTQAKFIYIFHSIISIYKTRQVSTIIASSKMPTKSRYLPISHNVNMAVPYNCG